MKRGTDGLGSDELVIMPLGAGNEVGRSCIILKFKGKTIMLDCGVHPAYSGIGALPFFDEIDPEAVDLVLITHFHLDHAAGLPYFMEKTGFKGKVYMTHPTKAIYKWMLSDYVKVSNVANTSADEALYTDVELARSYERITTIDYHQEIEVDGVRFTALNAGHVLGAAMFVIEIAGVRVLYTGDYSREEDRHLMAAETPADAPAVLICEATYGVQMHQPRLERERRFTGLVHDIVRRGGRCLIPVFALGRAQELLLILDEYWQAHPDLQAVPVYYASPMAHKCMAVYQTYVNMMNDHIRRQIAVANPFVFKHIRYLKGGRGSFKDDGPCVMMASPGMLQNGLSRELLEQWAPHKQNGLLIPGYVVEGTMGKFVLTHPKEITSLQGHSLPLRMSVDYISFSAHVDFAQNAEFIDLLRPPHLVLVHGEQNEMHRLKAALTHKYSHAQPEAPDAARPPAMAIHTPRNCEAVTLTFAGEKMLKVHGKLAKRAYRPGDTIEGVLVGTDFEYQLVHPDEIQDVTKARATRLLQQQTITCGATPSLIEHVLGNLVGPAHVRRTPAGFLVQELYELAQDGRLLTLSWEAGVLEDLAADALLAALVAAEVLPSSVKASLSRCAHGHANGAPALTPPAAALRSFLEGYFGPLQHAADKLPDALTFDLDGDPVQVGTAPGFPVTCPDADKQARVAKLVAQLAAILPVDAII